MKIQNLPSKTLSNLALFFNQEDRINFLKSVHQFHKEPTPNESPRFYCYFCSQSLWYYDLAMGQTMGGGEDFSFILRNELSYQELVKGDDLKPYVITHYRRRHFSAPDEERKISHIYQYLGNKKLFKNDFLFNKPK